MEEKHLVGKAAGAVKLYKAVRCMICVFICISAVLQPIPCMAAKPAVSAAKSDSEIKSDSAAKAAVTFLELNDDTVFLKQSQAHVCTLTSAAMMVRRAAMLSGSKDWRQITEQSVRKYAWAEGTGLKWNFTVAGISVAHKSLSSKNELIKLLDKHPEGIVIYNSRKPHAILVTDYTDGVFYCSDPSNDRPSGRYPIDRASITAESAGRCWYVKKPVNLTVIGDTVSSSSDQEAADSAANSGLDSDLNSDSSADQSTKQSDSYNVDNLVYQIADEAEKTAVCTGQVKEKTSAAVPDTVKIQGEEYKVVQIAESAFAGAAKLKEITVGVNVTAILPKAFYQCKKLKKVTIHAANLKEIGADAFAKINKKVQILMIADQMETSAKLLTGTALPETAKVEFRQGTASGI